MQNKSWIAAGVWSFLSLLGGLILNSITNLKIFWTLGVLLAIGGLFLIVGIDWRYKWW